MLPINFQTYLEEIDEGNSKEFRITKPPQGSKFKIVAYSQVGIYTLVQWKLEGREEDDFGEYLYRDQTPVATDQYLALHEEEPSSSTATPLFAELDVWNIIDPALGNYGVPTHIAHQLRKNLIRFIPKI